MLRNEKGSIVKLILAKLLNELEVMSKREGFIELASEKEYTTETQRHRGKNEKNLCESPVTLCLCGEKIPVFWHYAPLLAIS
jgi:hypothetical protein